MGKVSRRGFAKGLLGGLIGIVGVVGAKCYEPLAGEIEPTTNLPANDLGECVSGFPPAYHSYGSGELLQVDNWFINCTSGSEHIPSMECRYDPNPNYSQSERDCPLDQHYVNMTDEEMAVCLNKICAGYLVNE